MEEDRPMKALVLTNERTLALTDRPKPTVARPTDVVVRVVQTGICGTDRSVLVGKFPAEPGVVMGHEAVGVVDQVGPEVGDFAPGDRVIINPTLYCGACPTCLKGARNFCENKTGQEVGLDLDGAFAEYIRLPALFVHRMPDDMTYDRAVVVEPLACALNNVDAGGVGPGDTVVIVGGGPMGVVTAMAAEHYGARVLLVEPDPFRQQLCADILTSSGTGRVTVHHPDDEALTGNGDVVIDTVGNLLEQALGYAAVGATVVVMGYNSTAVATVRPLDILLRGLRIVGAGDFNAHSFPKAIGLARWLPLDKVITHRFDITEWDDAFGMLAPTAGSEYAAMKVVIRP
jgi:2-desacetyl-2-hydroxyethyl bacteriochlorophyllide A dehydrogenase